ncbi:MAG: hypothetical protein ACRDVZ_06515, partial [Jiangellaceae bacterium]
MLASSSGDDEAQATPPVTSTEPAGAGPEASTEPSETSAPATGLALTAAQPAVASGERIDLTGSITPAEPGVTLQIQRSVDGSDWEDFPVTADTNDAGTFSTYVQSSRKGENRFRVVRSDNVDVASEPVTVTIS